MHITPLLIYWISQLDTIGTFCIVSGMIAPVASIALSIYRCSEDVPDEDIPSLGRTIKILIAYMVCAFTLGAFLPSTKTAAAMIIIPQIANSKTVADLGGLGEDLVTLAHAWAQELKPISQVSK